MAQQQIPAVQPPQLPPQLAEMLPGPAALSASRFCELAPGIPFSAEVLDDILNAGVTECVALPTGFANGMNILVGYHVFDHRVVKSVRVKQISATVKTYLAGNVSELFVGKTFPHDRSGLRHAIEFTQRSVNNLKRKGFCPCWEIDQDVKRICIAKTGRCAKCIVKVAHE